MNVCVSVYFCARGLVWACVYGFVLLRGRVDGTRLVVVVGAWWWLLVVGCW